MFGAVTSTSGILVLSVMVAVGVFLAVQASQALRKTGFSFLTTSEWQPDRGKFGHVPSRATAGHDDRLARMHFAP